MPPNDAERFVREVVELVMLPNGFTLAKDRVRREADRLRVPLSPLACASFVNTLSP